jgi:hypothetical protein
MTASIHASTRIRRGRRNRQLVDASALTASSGRTAAITFSPTADHTATTTGALAAGLVP